MTDAEKWKVSLPSWRDGSARRSVIAFLQEITQGPDALPVADRVAAFDNDGTLACEKPHTALAGFLLDRAAAAGSVPPEAASGHDVLRELGVLFTGQTTAQYEEQARRYLTGALHPRFHRPYPMLTYQPMLELMALLQALDFSVFMCTDSSRDFMRVIAGPAYGLRRERVIGSEVQIQAVDGRLVRTAMPVPMDDGPGKTVHLWDRTGTQPVLAAGNAAGDIDMLRAARFALVVHHDDNVREYAYDDRLILNAAAGGGWTVLSMRDDFARVWPAASPMALGDRRACPAGPQILFSTRAWSVLRSILGFLALVLNLAGTLLSLALGCLRLVLCLLSHTHDRLLFATRHATIRWLPSSTLDAAQTRGRAGSVPPRARREPGHQDHADEKVLSLEVSDRMRPGTRGRCRRGRCRPPAPPHDARQGGVRPRGVEGTLHEPQPDQGDSCQASKRQLVSSVAL